MEMASDMFDIDRPADLAWMVPDELAPWTLSDQRARYRSLLLTRSEDWWKNAVPGRDGLWRHRRCRRSLLLLGGGDCSKAKDANEA